MTERRVKTTEIRDLEVASGGHLDVTAQEDQVLRITLPGGRALPAGVHAVRVGDSIVLRYPDGTEINISTK